MPQLSGQFGPIAQQTVLDGSGNGTVSFQVNGGNARFTNIFVRCSSATLQAVAKIYRGAISDTNLINQTNSGSTGAAATGAIDVTDGVTLFIVWSGGDAGATATVTFVGYTIPFSEAKSAIQLVWDNPIAANDGTLIFPAIQSVGFQSGVTGWRLDRNGNLEANNGTFRGDFWIPSINAKPSLHLYMSGSVPSIDAAVADQGAVQYNAAWFRAQSNVDTTAQLEIRSPQPGAANASSAIDLIGGPFAVPDPYIGVTPSVRNSALGNMHYFPGQLNTVTINVNAGGGGSLLVTFPIPFAAGVTPLVFVNCTNSAGTYAAAVVRGTTPTNTNFTIVVNGVSGGLATVATVQWIALHPNG